MQEERRVEEKGGNLCLFFHNVRAVFSAIVKRTVMNVSTDQDCPQNRPTETS
jgi:hypothetical protein